eukprot:scaffold940_cov569-Prasinococcus_capsulatus_cf.AAC.24
MCPLLAQLRPLRLRRVSVLVRARSAAPTDGLRRQAQCIGTVRPLRADTPRVRGCSTFRRRGPLPAAAAPRACICVRSSRR